MAQSYLQARAKHLVTAVGGADTTKAAPLAGSLAARAATTDRFLDAKRDLLARSEITYADLDVSLSVLSMSRTDSTVRLRVHEVTELFPPAGSPEPSTAYAIDRLFVFTRAASGWVIADQRIPDDVGLSPITEHPGALTESSPETSLPEIPIGAADGSSAAPPGSLPDGAAATTGRRSLGGSKEKTATASGSGDFSTQAIPAGLCYSCMINYAYQYWDNYNSSYRDFSANGGGGDCTNFISQIMYAGGWQMVSGFYQNNNYWWYNWLNQTYTWAGAENWSIFAPKRTNYLSNVWYLLASDVMQMDFNRDGIMDHSMVVTKSNSTNIYLTYHTSDHKDRPLTEILSAYTSAWYYAYRT